MSGAGGSGPSGEKGANTCLHCGAEIRLMRYALGDQFVHVDRHASFPTKEKGTAWQHCRLTVAEPSNLSGKPSPTPDTAA